MGLFDEFTKNNIKTNVYGNVSNQKIKQEKKERDRFLTKEEISREKALDRNRRYWRRRVKEGQTFNQEMYAERDEYWNQYPVPITTPNEIDNLYLNEYRRDICGSEYAGDLCKRHLAYGRQHPKRYFKLYSPIKVIYSQSLENRYLKGIEIQCNIYRFLINRIDEIMDNYSRNHRGLDSSLKHNSGLRYSTVTKTRSRKIVNEWKELYGPRGSSMMYQAVKDIYNYGYWSPLQGLHGIGPNYLIGDVMFDGFGHCSYISNFGNDLDYLSHRNELHSMFVATKDRTIDKEELNKVPYFIMDRPILVRVPSNKIQIIEEQEGVGRKKQTPYTEKSNNGEYDYYWMSLAGYNDFPKRKDIEKKFGRDDGIIKSKIVTTIDCKEQSLGKTPRNLYIEER